MPILLREDEFKGVKPLCPVFGECGGCSYQNISYSEELASKQKFLAEVFSPEFDPLKVKIREIIPSPKPYHYRNRLDLKLLRSKDGQVHIGFSPTNKYRVVEIEECPIAIKEISDFIPNLKKQAAAKLTSKYRNANLTIRTGDDGRVLWGGIGRRSCQLEEKDYLWTKLGANQIFYSLDTFFQANLSILPAVFKAISSLDFISPKTNLFDLYGGVGLFGIMLSAKVKKVILIEETIQSIKLAQHNVSFNRLKNFDIHPGRVEALLEALLVRYAGDNTAIVDPPRAGLSPEALKMLAESKKLEHLLYLSCNPKALAANLKEFLTHNWKIKELIPFDFFPKTQHLETLAILER